MLQWGSLKVRPPSFPGHAIDLQYLGYPSAYPSICHTRKPTGILVDAFTAERTKDQGELD